MEFLKREKTYILCLGWIVYTLLGVYLGKLGWKTTFGNLYQAGVIATLRHGLSTELVINTLRDVNQPKSKAKFSLAPDTSAGQSAQLNPWDDSAASAFFTELSFFGADDQKDADAICVETRSYIHRYM
jgi:hypothetical protein